MVTYAILLIICYVTSLIYEKLLHRTNLQALALVKDYLHNLIRSKMRTWSLIHRWKQKLLREVAWAIVDSFEFTWFLNNMCHAIFMLTIKLTLIFTNKLWNFSKVNEQFFSGNKFYTFKIYLIYRIAHITFTFKANPTACNPVISCTWRIWIKI